MARQATRRAVEAEPALSQRLDKWLWFARVAKTRTLAGRLVSDGRVRVNRERITKPAQLVKIADVITVSVPAGVRVLEVLAVGVRRGPASEAASLYHEIVPLQRSNRVGANSPGKVGHGVPVSDAGSGRPTKKDRRLLDRLRAREGD